MTPTRERDLSRINALDYLLMTLGSCLAGYSGGMSVGLPALGMFTATGILIGAVISYAIRVTLNGNPILRLDGWLYTCGVGCAFAFTQQLQVFMPEGGFPLELIAAGWLSWMLIIGSFFTWQDTTLLFQSIPAIALFGLVGCYDTFSGVTFAFFGFLLCLATLFGRAHRRSMLRQAADSGYFTRGLAPGTPTPSVETTPGLARRMEAGPWRWIAGPEWALASALAVVTLSLLGAPVIKSSIQASGLSGFVKLPMPRSVRQRLSPPTSGTTEDFRGNVSVANGPNNTLTDDPIFEVQMDGLHYLHSSSYDTFRGRSWASTGNDPADKEYDSNADAYAEVAQAREIDFRVRLRQRARMLPVPGILVSLSGTLAFKASKNGNIVLSGDELEFSGRAIPIDTVPTSIFALTRNNHSPTPTEAQKTLNGALKPYGDPQLLAPRVASLLHQITAGAKTDFERAVRIRDEISQRITYNIQASAAPSGQDILDYVLFDSHEGYCDVYATSMTLMARAAGIPSRYVIGYLPESSNQDKDGRYVVLDRDLHAWSELYFKGYGWVVFDATDGAKEVPGAGRQQSTASKPFFEQAWVRATIDGLIGFLLLLGVFLVVKPVLQRKRGWTPRKELEAEYLSFSRALERFARTRRDPSRTPDEFLSDVREQLGDSAPTAEEINRRFVRLMYSPASTCEADLAEIRGDLRKLKQMLRDQSHPKETTATK